MPLTLTAHFLSWASGILFHARNSTRVFKEPGEIYERERVAKGQRKCVNPFHSCLMRILVRLANQHWLPWYTSDTHTHTNSTIDLTPWVLSVKACLLIQPYRGFLKAQTCIWYTSIQEKQRKYALPVRDFPWYLLFLGVKIVKIIFKPFYFCI